MSHEGYLRHLVIRKGINTGELLINIVTTSQIDFDLTDYINILANIELNGNIVGILHTLNDSFSDTVTPEKIEILYGRDYFYDILLDKNLKFHHFLFSRLTQKEPKLCIKQL